MSLSADHVAGPHARVGRDPLSGVCRCRDCGRAWGEGEVFVPYCGGAGWLDYRIAEVVARCGGREPRPPQPSPVYRNTQTTAHWGFSNPFCLMLGDTFTIEFNNGTMEFDGPTTVRWSDG